MPDLSSRGFWPSTSSRENPVLRTKASLTYSMFAPRSVTMIEFGLCSTTRDNFCNCARLAVNASRVRRVRMPKDKSLAISLSSSTSASLKASLSWACKHSAPMHCPPSTSSGSAMAAPYPRCNAASRHGANAGLVSTSRVTTVRRSRMAVPVVPRPCGTSAQEMRAVAR